MSESETTVTGQHCKCVPKEEAPISTHHPDAVLAHRMASRNAMAAGSSPHGTKHSTFRRSG